MWNVQNVLQNQSAVRLSPLCNQGVLNKSRNYYYYRLGFIKYLMCFSQIKFMVEQTSREIVHSNTNFNFLKNTTTLM